MATRNGKPRGAVVETPTGPEVTPGSGIGAFTELGSTGLRRFSGYIFEEFLRVLQGRKAAEIYREMRENDAVVNAMLFSIEYLARQVSWDCQVPEGDESAEAQKVRDYVWSCFGDMS